MEELTRAFWTIGMILATFLGLILFLLSSVICAEFIRRERTATKDDDWFERTKIGNPSVCTNIGCGHSQLEHTNTIGACTWDCPCLCFRNDH